MIEILFFILFIAVFGKILGFILSATWGLFKILLYIVLLPAILLLLVFGGFLYIALPILIVIGVLSLIESV
ncbi:MAG: hypothetical protein K6E13_03455 [Lachnospiraceae bacterium]|nr:hypothetical protein [Lachnospiraceae bacterium]